MNNSRNVSNDNTELDRRRWLHQASIGLAGGALLAAGGNQPLQSDDLKKQQDEAEQTRQRFLQGDCPQVLRVSKNLTGELKLTPQKPCPCFCDYGPNPAETYRINYKGVLTFQSAKPCDETNAEPLLQDGVELWLKGEMILRVAMCPETEKKVLIGRATDTSQVHRYRPNEDIFVGTSCSTIGFRPYAERERCCAMNESLGTSCTKGVNTMTDWDMSVSYVSRIHGLSPESICEEQVVKVESSVDGVLLGPCRTIEQKSR